MNILLIGYGKMGKAIEAIALQRNHHIVGKINSLEELKSFEQPVDIAIEFSHPEAVIENLKYCFENQIPVVCGTTGWLQHKSEIESYCQQNNGGFFYASNFGLGVNIFFKLNAYLARLMAPYTSYTVFINEIHHTQKIDAPSGTAITLAEGIIKNQPHIKQWQLGESQTPHTLTINSIREDSTPGTHIVTYHSTVDHIEINHTAHSREGFAQGAVLVAEWMKEKKGIYSMDDFLVL